MLAASAGVQRQAGTPGGAGSGCPADAAEQAAAEALQAARAALAAATRVLEANAAAAQPGPRKTLAALAG